MLASVCKRIARKQYLPLAGQTILDRTIDIFISHPLIAGVLVGVGENDAYWSDSKWQQHDLVHMFVGGKERCDTVQKGLRYLLDTVDVMQQDVLVHDAARPLLSQAALNRIIHHTSDQGALLAMPAKDTVKLQVLGQPLVDAQTLTEVLSGWRRRHRNFLPKRY